VTANVRAIVDGKDNEAAQDCCRNHPGEYRKSALLKLNMHPRVFQERLRHSTIAITLGIFSRDADRSGRGC
jgi:hypothetical protein